MIYLERDYHLLTSPRFVHLDSEQNHPVLGSRPRELRQTKGVTIPMLPKGPDTVSVLIKHKGKTGVAGGILEKET